MTARDDGRTAAEIDEMLDRFRGALPGLKVPDRREWDRSVTDERDHWIRLFNRLEAAVTHHKSATRDFATDADEALYAARDRILADAAHGPDDG